ncbi:MAG TPA: outer membrane beta-barrel protein [Polyangiaceae bacterium]|nr:outer membrane beta-barrel protein [Polyangiaceae bacterium]
MTSRKPFTFSMLLIAGAASYSLSAAAQQRDPDPPRAPDGPALPDVAPSSPSGRFGGKSQIAVSSDTGFSIGNTSVSGVDGSTTTLVLRPAVDYFVADYISIGGFLGLDYTSTPGGSTTTFSIGPRVGYNVPLSERFSLWPKVGFAFASTSQKQDDTQLATGQTVDSNDESNTSLQLNIFAPFMFHPVNHFFVGLGPAFDLDLTGDNKATTIAARLALGGWL